MQKGVMVVCRAGFRAGSSDVLICVLHVALFPESLLGEHRQKHGP